MRLQPWILRELRIAASIICVGGLGISFYWMSTPNRNVDKIHRALEHARRSGDPEVKLQCTLEALNRTKQINPNDHRVYELYFCLAAQYERQRKWNQARFHYTQALQHVATRTDSVSVLRRMIAL